MYLKKTGIVGLLIERVMKQLQLTPPLLILTMGYPGAGKTFFARQVSEEYGIPRISQDVIRFELFEQPTFAKEESEIIDRVQHYAVSELMKAKVTIICEGTYLEAAQRKSVYELATKNGYRVLTVWLQTDVQTAAARSMHRDRRNQDSKHSFELSKDTFLKIRATLQRPSEKEDFVVISGKHAFKSQALTMLRKITSLYSESIAKGDYGVKNSIGSAKVTRSRPATLIQ